MIDNLLAHFTPFPCKRGTRRAAPPFVCGGGNNPRKGDYRQAIQNKPRDGLGWTKLRKWCMFLILHSFSLNNYAVIHVFMKHWHPTCRSQIITWHYVILLLVSTLFHEPACGLTLNPVFSRPGVRHPPVQIQSG